MAWLDEYVRRGEFGRARGLAITSDELERVLRAQQAAGWWAAVSQSSQLCGLPALLAGLCWRPCFTSEA